MGNVPLFVSVDCDVHMLKIWCVWKEKGQLLQILFVFNITFTL